MKLELKHLSAYLPYGIKRYRPNSVDLIREIDYLELNQSMIDYHEKVEWKLILRPLSDLTKEIESNGKNFVPIIELCNLELYGYSDLRHMINSNNFQSIESLSMKSFTQLTEWHFDVFGLIDAGLAIDINTLNK